MQNIDPIIIEFLVDLNYELFKKEEIFQWHPLLNINPINNCIEIEQIEKFFPTTNKYETNFIYYKRLMIPNLKVAFKSKLI